MSKQCDHKLKLFYRRSYQTRWNVYQKIYTGQKTSLVHINKLVMTQ